MPPKTPRAETVNVKDLKFDHQNANRGTERGAYMLENSIREHGFLEAGTLDKNNVLIGGNKRTQASQEAGLSDDAIVIDVDGTRPVYIRRNNLDLNTTEGRRAAYALNRVAQTSIDFDPEQLARDLSQGLDLSDMWFQEELDELLASVSGLEEPPEAPEPEIDKAEELREKWGVEYGQLWQVGRHRVLCGDSTKREDVERLLDGNKPDMIFSDPPYGIDIVAANGYVGGGEAYDIPFGGVKNRGSDGASKPFGSKKKRTGTDGASNIVEVGKYLPVKGDETTDTAVHAFRLIYGLYEDCVHFWWGANYYANALPPSSCWIVWDKQNTGNFADAELAWSSSKSSVRIFSHMWNGMLKASEHGAKRVHPTQKPVALAEWCIDNYAPDSSIIFDPFGGSGMCTIAANKKEKACYSIEYEDSYVGVILERLSMMGLTPELLDA